MTLPFRLPFARAFAGAAPALAALALASCGGGTPENMPGGDSSLPYAGVGEQERSQPLGNAPFWGGEVTGGTLRYNTPEDIDGQTIAVERFAGRGGLSFTGTLDGAEFVLAVTDHLCSDTMSDRTYPFTATLRIGTETRHGCGWTAARPFTGPQAPCTGPAPIPSRPGSAPRKSTRDKLSSPGPA